MNIIKLFFLFCEHQAIALVCIGACLLVISCSSSNLILTEVELQVAKMVPGMRFLPFTTGKGRQLAFYVPAKAKPNKLPEWIVIVFPGFKSKALDRLDWVESMRRKNTGILLIDYPGRGRCEGILRPKQLPWTTTGALSALGRELKVTPKQFEGRFFVVAHSFGCAAALQFSKKHNVQRIVLMAPFITLKQAMSRRIGPLAWIIPDNLDNRKALINILKHRPGTKVTIIHGALDKSIPFQWGRDLAAIDRRITFHEVSDGTHISILTENMDLVINALFNPKHRTSESLN